MANDIFNCGPLLRRVLNVVLPLRCVFCRRPSAPDRCCPRCAGLLLQNTAYCRRCANPLPGGSENLCAACQQRTPSFAGAVAPLRYQFPVDSALKALKFRRELCYVPVFSDWLLTALQTRALPVDGIVPVPLHWSRYARRGFNQARLLAARVARDSGLPLVDVATRRRATRPQSELSAGARRSNLHGAFAVRGRCPLRRPLIVDDVMTTGHTCNELARALQAAGADDVYVLVVARADAG